MKACLVSSEVRGDFSTTLREMEEGVKIASEEKCDLVAFPEYLVAGNPTGDYEIDSRHAATISGEFVNHLTELAGKYGLYLATGFIEREEDVLYDSAILISRTGKLELRYRRLSSSWKPRYVPAGKYLQGTHYAVKAVEFGRVGFAICGDVFFDDIVERIRRAALDYLIVPLYRGYDTACRTYEEWHNKEKLEYAVQIGKMQSKALIINAFRDVVAGSVHGNEKHPAFGGSWVISSSGQVLSERDIGSPGLHIYDLKNENCA